jgi:hypothetical protein
MQVARPAAFFDRPLTAVETDPRCLLDLDAPRSIRLTCASTVLGDVPFTYRDDADDLIHAGAVRVFPSDWHDLEREHRVRVELDLDSGVTLAGQSFVLAPDLPAFVDDSALPDDVAARQPRAFTSNAEEIALDVGDGGLWLQTPDPADPLVWLYFDENVDAPDEGIIGPVFVHGSHWAQLWHGHDTTAELGGGVVANVTSGSGGVVGDAFKLSAGVTATLTGVTARPPRRARRSRRCRGSARASARSPPSIRWRWPSGPRSTCSWGPAR